MNFLYNILRNIYGSTVIVLGIGFCIGFILGILFIQVEKKNEVLRAKVLAPSKFKSEKSIYLKWLSSQGYESKCLTSDLVSYGNLSIDTEAIFLKKQIHVLCVVFVKDVQKAHVILKTWGKHCNRVLFFGLFKNSIFPIKKLNPKSSWHFLCDAIRSVWTEHKAELQWVLFAPDDIFSLPENLRLFVSSLDYNLAHYLGHALARWGDSYNVAQAGYALSRGAIALLNSMFNSSESCEKGGKYWKNEDYYLGKHLGAMGVYPMDTRDKLNRGRFHGYNFNQLLFSRKLSPLNSYWKRSIYPIKEGHECCSDTSVTFHGVEPDKVHQYYYLLYRLKSFPRGGSLGNRPAPTPLPEGEVWRRFLVEEGLLDHPEQYVSPQQFYELSLKKVQPPSLFNEALRREAGGQVL